MNIDLVDKFLNSKKNKIYEYATRLMEIISIESNDLWNNKKKFNSIVKPIIDFYITNHYLSDDAITCSLNFNDELDNVIAKYFEIFPKSNIYNILSFVFICFEKTNSIENIKKHNDEILLLGIILAISIDLDVNNNPLTRPVINREKVVHVLELFLPLRALIINTKGKVISDFVKILRIYYQNEKEFYSIFNNKHYFNSFILDKKGFYYVEFNKDLKIPEVSVKELEQVLNENNYEAKIYFIFCNLLLMTMIKQKLMCNHVDNYIIPYNRVVYEKENNYLKIFKLFNDKGIKEHIYILINKGLNIKSDYVNKLEQKGFKIIYKEREYDMECNKIKEHELLRKVS